MKILSILFVSVLAFSQYTYAKNLTVDDIVAATAIVSVRMQTPFKVEMIDSGPPVPVTSLWVSEDNSCHVYIFVSSIHLIQVIIDKYDNSDTAPFLEGMIAHETSHCWEQREKYKTTSELRLSFFLSTPNEKTRWELLADIVSIMYWKQYYPDTADHYVATELTLRKMFNEKDPSHADYNQLVKALPLIPNVINFEEAQRITSSVY